MTMSRLFYVPVTRVFLALACLLPAHAFAFRLLTAADSPHFFQQELVIPKGDTLYLGPGAVLLFGEDSNLIIEGKFFALGTKSRPVLLAPAKGLENWGKLIFRNAGSMGSLRHVRLEGIRMQTLETDLQLQFVEFHRRKRLTLAENTLLFRKGSLWVDQSVICGNGTGEGLIIIKGRGQVKVQNSYFEAVSDAVEFIQVDSGIILGNVILAKNAEDDGIDLNGCLGVQILYNQVVGYPDQGIEIGDDNFGPCHKIICRGNVLRDCKTGMVVKEGSMASLQGNLFLNNEVALHCATLEKGRGPGTAYSRNCWFLGTENEVFRTADEGSIHARWSWIIPAS